MVELPNLWGQTLPFRMGYEILTPSRNQSVEIKSLDKMKQKQTYTASVAIGRQPTGLVYGQVAPRLPHQQAHSESD